MNIKVNLKAKQDYLYWFITNYRLKHSQAAKLLYYLASNHQLLARVTFTRFLQPHANTILVSAQGSKTFPFICKINGLHYNNVDEIIHLLINYPPENIYCRLVIPKSPACQFCVTERRLRVVNPVKNALATEQRLANLTRAIDRALDEKNDVAFYRLSLKLKQLK